MKFVHAADLHIDSPLKGLDAYAGAPAARMRAATRGALQNLVALCIDEQAAFLLLAGDIFDGSWKDFSTGLFFHSQMARLKDANIPVVIVRGNHDAASAITKSLRLPDNVHELSSKKPETLELRDAGACVHGQSFAHRVTTDDLAARYPDAVAGAFNVGLLHTCVEGREGHERYAPTSLATMRSKGYAYWALGHVHAREVLSTDPWIVFPGNLQGRHAKEIGPKGASLVTVEDGVVKTVEHRAVDVVRWDSIVVDVSEAGDGIEVVDRLREALRERACAADERFLAARVTLTGATRANRHIRSDVEKLIAEARAAANELGDTVWLEKVRIETRTKVDLARVREEPGAVGHLARRIAAIRGDLTELGELGQIFAELDKRLPSELREGRDGGEGALVLSDPETLRAIVDDVEHTLLPRLLEGSEAEAMKIAKLDLLAYGPFLGLELDLSAPGVHVVFGRNEAGKSTTLRAITGLLYGIDVRTKDAHVHKPGELRIGGTLVARDGTEVRVVRRKGAANTLLDDAGQAIDESVLLRTLHGVSKETFENAFGLDLFSLQGGGRALLDGKGDIGGSLFDASAGGVDAQRVLTELTEEAERLYKPRAPTSELAIALKDFEHAKKSIQQKERLPEGYTSQEEALRAEKAVREQKTAERAALVLRKAQLDRIKNRLPRDRKKKELVAKLEALGPLVKHRPRIESLHQRLGAYEIASTGRSSFAAEAESLRGQVAEAARRAGVAVDPRTGGITASPLVDERTAKRIQTLVSEGTKLAGAIDRAREETERSERDLARARAAGAPTADTTLDDTLLAALQGALGRARDLGDTKGRLALESSKVAKRKAEVDTRVTALRAFVKAAEELVAMKLPLRETVQRLAERAAEIDKAIERLVVRDQEAETKERALERQIAASSGDFAPPDKSALDAARKARDAALGALRDARAKKAVDAGSLVALEADLERALREADAVADRMIADADRVTALARFRAEHANYGKERAEWRAEREKAVSKRAALDEEHAKLWSPAGITPLGFAEMLAWLERHAQVVESFERLREARIDASEIEAAMATARSELASAMVSAGVLVAPNATLGDLADAATARVERVVSSRRTAVEAARSIEKHAVQLDERRATSARDEAALAENRAKSKELRAPLGLPHDVTGEEILHALDARKDLSALEEKRAAVAARAALAESDARSFEEDAAKCAADLSTDLVGLSARDVTMSLVARSHAAHAHEQELASTEQELAELGDCSVPDDLAPIAADPSLLERALEDFEAQINELDIALSRLTQSIGGHEMGMQLMQGDTGAAEAAAATQEALARVRALAERYARAKVGAVILAREIERYREQNQGPLLQTASRLFARLTLGAYSGVRAAFDEKDRHTLHCVRAGNVDVDIDGLSEGTRDQLYLSLRLASLLRHCETAEPMPIVLDDVLVQFDDERSRAALSVFAEVSENLQILFFTHHARHVELAREAIASEKLTVHELAAGKSGGAPGAEHGAAEVREHRARTP